MTPAKSNQKNYYMKEEKDLEKRLENLNLEFGKMYFNLCDKIRRLESDLKELKETMHLLIDYIDTECVYKSNNNIKLQRLKGTKNVLKNSAKRKIL
ncbi:MAG: hypothetical protein LBQ47_03675 [Endomicrobium sp.]|jgi:CRISPR/Cas system CSM-associated protein Csm2 small subunit|nr:hypothetical protein [Endomicrobium sp.]